MTHPPPAIELVGVACSHGAVAALRDVSLTVARGERVALLGPSGAGKTTLMRVLNLGLAPRAGVYRLDGVEVAGLAARARRALRSHIATIHQRQDLVGRLSALRNVLAGRLGRWGRLRALRVFAMPSAAEVAEVAAVLERVAIADKLHARADRLSGGQLQRLAIARALYQDARLVLADEPVSSVDPALAEAVLALLVRTAADDGRTLVASLHQPELARRHFARIVGLKAGAIAFDLPAERVDRARLDELFGGEPRVEPPAEASPEKPAPHPVDV